jgi:osmotically-inducible protein OsmY
MSNDTNLQSAILAEFNWEPSLIATHIGVTVDNGVVALTGHVGSFAEKAAAETAATRVRGVLAVADEIEVRLPFESTRNDEDIAAAAVNRIGWDVRIPPDAVKIRVEAGWVTLTGTVSAAYQRAAAEHEIRPLMGVIGVSNQIALAPRVNAAALGSDLMLALHRSWLFDPQTISVTAVGGNIRLTGSVHTQHERQLATVTAWSAPGATSVQNDLAIL